MANIGWVLNDKWHAIDHTRETPGMYVDGETKQQVMTGRDHCSGGFHFGNVWEVHASGALPEDGEVCEVCAAWSNQRAIEEGLR